MKYHAKAEQDGRFWLVHVPEIDQYTQARNLREVEPVARDLVAVMREVAPDSFNLEVSVELPAETRARWERSKQLHAEAAALQARAAEEAQQAAQALAASGLTLREIGLALGVSFQRAGQLAKPPATKKTVPSKRAQSERRHKAGSKKISA